MWKICILILMIATVAYLWYKLDKWVEHDYTIEKDKALQFGYEMGLVKGKADATDKACEFFEQYLAEIGYPDDWCRGSEVQKSGEQRFREFMEE